MRQPTHRIRQRAGNTMVLVVGILALLVIIATAYVTRTHSGRLTAVSMKRAAVRDDNQQTIAQSIGAEIAQSLFVRPVDPTQPLDLALPAGSNAARLALAPLDFGGIVYMPVPFGVDPIDSDGDGAPDFPYNFAPFHVVPFTNWPDGVSWPRGPGAPGGIAQIMGALGSAPIGEGNPIGNPGYSDWRWLCDFEPVRIRVPNLGDAYDAFSHWRHMTNLSGAHNGWRICRDISDVEDLLLDLSIPVEQWLSFTPPDVDLDSGRSIMPADFFNQWQAWMSPSYQAAYINFGGGGGFGPFEPPANFYDLADLNGDGVRHAWVIQGVPQERPESEFIRGTARWNLSRVLTDTDGDGFTDAFWHLVPTSIEGGIRQICAVRIVDNSAMLNVNAATRFVRTDPVGSAVETATRGETPADLALAGDLADPQYTLGGLGTGFFDNPLHHEVALPLSWNWPPAFGDTGVYWDPSIWPLGPNNTGITFLGELGILVPDPQTGDVAPHMFFPDVLQTADERRAYWQIAGRHPLSATWGLTPFTLADEIELRSYHGQNMPWIATRLERAVQSELRRRHAGAINDLPQLLHANVLRRETSEYLDKLWNPELLFDSRRKLTVYSGARNDLMPPWLWVNPERWQQKIDLRWELDQDDYQDLDGDPNDWEIKPDLIRTRGEDIRDVLQRAFMVTDVGGLTPRASYYGTSVNDAERTRELAAAFAANIVGYQARGIQTVPDTIKTTPHQPFIDEAVPVSTNLDKRFTSVQPQPFLVEAFIGYLYRAWEIEPQWSNAGEHIVLHGGTVPGAISSAPLPTTIVAVQIANPFDVEVDARDFVLRVYGRDVDLGTAGITNNIIEPGEAITLYSIEAQYEGEDTLTAFSAELDLGTLGEAVSVSGLSPVRDDYDAAGDKEIQIVRRMRQTGGNTIDVVVDRLDSPGSPDFENAVDSLNRPQPGDDVNPTPPGFPIIASPNIGAETHMTYWARASRGWELNNEQPNRRNPRYVFGGKELSLEPTGDPHLVSSGAVTGLDLGGVKFGTKAKEVPSVTGQLDFPMQMLVKNNDFQQLGELLNVWLYGHELDVVIGGSDIIQSATTATTFSERMWDDVGQLAPEDKARVNRMPLVPLDIGGQTVNPIFAGNSGILNDSLHRSPALTPGARALEAFVCNGAGMLMDWNEDGVVNNNDQRPVRQFLLSSSTRLTPGMINVNTAPVEVLRAAPHMARLVHPTDPPTGNPFVRVPEAIVHYRDRYNGNGAAQPLPTGIPDGADYAVDRDGDASSDLRGERGFATIAELPLLTKAAAMDGPGIHDPARNWRIDFAALAPFGVSGLSPDSTPLSTDVNGVWDPAAMQTDPDDVAQDLEEQNLLFSGMSNLITTRSDVFTVYFRIRSFEQNPTTGFWDATDPEHILDDSRYVMLVDRSEVRSPQDKPKILYLEKIAR